MITTTVDTTGLDRLRARFDRIANPDPTPLLIRIADLMDKDNRDGVLDGKDGNGNQMMPVTYRPVSAKTGRPVKVGAKLTVAQRLGQKPTKTRGSYSRIGSGIERANNNLTSAEYRLLGGPPLAPRKQFSRVITNYMQSFGQISTRTWQVVGAWINVLSVKGVPFLRFHFDGVGHQWKRDLRGIRPEGRERIRATARAWMISEIRSDHSGG
jgi:hypothetical protein